MILIIGGGIIGTSIAYYLAQAGVKDVTLIEKEKMLGCGVTQYCSGGVRSQFTTRINILFSQDSLKLLNRLKNKIDYKKYGYLILDSDADAKERVKIQRQLGINSEYLTPEQIKKRFPYVNTGGIKSGSFYKNDGIADPAGLLEYFEKGAKKNGVEFQLETKVKRILKENSKAVGIETNKGKILADLVVLAAGVQSKELGKTIGLDIPIVDKRKYVLLIEGFDFDFPIIMEIPKGWYIKKEGKDALVGMSGKFEKQAYEKQAEITEEIIEASLLRVPQTEKGGIKKTLSSLSDETPDRHAIIDNSIPGLIIATGFSGHGFMHSPATGQIVASLVKGEKPIIDVSELKLKRSHIRESIAI